MRVPILFRPILISCLLAFGATTAFAEPSASTAAEATSPAQSPQQLQQLLETLRDPDRRAALEAQIEGLIAVQRQAAAQAPAPERLGFGARLLAGASEGFAGFTAFIDSAGRAFADSTHLWDWLERQGLNPRQRGLWLEILRAVGLTIGGGLILALGIRAALRSPRRRLARRAEGGPFRRLRFSAVRFALDFLPVLAFALAALGIAAWLQPPEIPRLVMLAFINATTVSLTALVIARWLFSPMLPELRLLPMQDANAVYAYIWTRRLILVLVWGYVLLQTALLLGLPLAGYQVAVRLLGLILLGLLIVLVLQNREHVAHWIRGRPNSDGSRRIVPGALRARLAEIWHVAALLYIVAAYLVWAFDVADGFGYLLRATAITLLVIGLLALGETLLPRLFNRMSGIDAAIEERYPFVAARAGRYIPLFRRTIVYLVRIAALLVILAAWRVDVAGILFGESGVAALSRLADIVIVLVLALAAWEISSGLITARLNRRDASGDAVIRSARIRTLLPLIRNALMILISVMATLVILSEIGVDIAPLLAGAGVVGLAIGFGAQTLVKDVITGAFFMIEGTMNIGDVVDINGKGGLVEGMNVRSIRLRDYNGAVHTINFGSVGTVTNLTRDFSYYIFDTKIALRYDVEDVIAVLKSTGEEMRSDPRFQADILAPLEIAGVETFADTTFIVRSRIKTRPIRQWDVGREFQRRLKRNLQAAEIEMAVPGLPAHVTVASRHPGIAAAAMAATATPPDQEDAAAPESEDAPSKG